MRHPSTTDRKKDPRPEGSLLEGVRLNRYLAQHGICSRRAADQLIAEGRVEVNRKVVRQLGTIVDPDRDYVVVDGDPVSEALPPKVLLFHKPVGVLSTCKAGREKGPIVLDYLPADHRYYPVGRLDKDSSGLLIITDDGDIANRLSHPRYGSQKIYRIEVHPPLNKKQVAQLTRGVELEDGLAKPLHITEINPITFDITLGEGRKRQLRRMIAALGAEVLTLVRIEQAGLKLGNLRPGRWRELSGREVERLRSTFSDHSDQPLDEE